MKLTSLAMAAAMMLAATAALSQTHSGGMHGHHRFDDPSKWSQQFDSAARDAWQMPDQVVQALDLKPDAAEGAPKHMRLAAETVVAEMTAAGFEPTGSHAFLQHQYFLTFGAK